MNRTGINRVKGYIAVLLFLGFPFFTAAQEALLSDTEEYYDFLALRGKIERPYLNYRTLSDSVWPLDEMADHPWQNLDLGENHEVYKNLFIRFYGPELYSSYNTAAPYGQNDGALWQGKGFNVSLTGGIRFAAYGVELTLKPQLTASENAAFDLMPPAYSNANPLYAGKAGLYGYYGVPSVDAPQRFGGSGLWGFDWGDTEVRYTWKTLTIGFGTQAIWLGSSHINSILHSNNAPTYPKLDIGLRRTRVTIPFVNWYAGDIEFRLWAGYLSESDYFDNDDSNNHNLMTAVSLAYAPSFLPGLTLFANRNFLTKWNKKNFAYIGKLFFLSFALEDQIQEQEDQRASIGAQWMLPIAGIEVYGELALNDYSLAYIRYPFHAMGFNAGVRKALNIYPKRNVYGELLFEWIHLEMSRNYLFVFPTSFYVHYQITQGYTNRGQWLGAGIGTGGNGQYLGFKVYYPRGSGSIFLYRYNPDNDYVYMQAMNHIGADYKTVLAIGAETSYFLSDNVSLSGGLVYNLIYRPQYLYSSKHNVHLNLGAKMYF
jgi:hypothetical protein